MGKGQMDPDRFQMKDLKRRVASLEKKLDYVKKDLRTALTLVRRLEPMVETIIEHDSAIDDLVYWCDVLRDRTSTSPVKLERRGPTGSDHQ